MKILPHNFSSVPPSLATALIRREYNECFFLKSLAKNPVEIYGFFLVASTD